MEEKLSRRVSINAAAALGDLGFASALPALEKVLNQKGEVDLYVAREAGRSAVRIATRLQGSCQQALNALNGSGLQPR